MTPWLRDNVAVLSITGALIVGTLSGVGTVAWTLSARDAELDQIGEAVQRIEGWAQVVEARQREDERLQTALVGALRDDLTTMNGDIRVLQSLYDGLRNDVNRIMARLEISWGGED